MKVRYVCDCCREVIADLDDPTLTEERLGLGVLTDEERQQMVQIDAEAVILATLCDECSSALSPIETPRKQVYLH